MNGIKVKTVHIATRDIHWDDEIYIQVGSKLMPIKTIRISRGKVILIADEKA